MTGGRPAIAAAAPALVASSLRNFFASLKTRPRQLRVVAIGDQLQADDPDWRSRVCKADPNVTAELAWISGENAPNPCQFQN